MGAGGRPIQVGLGFPFHRQRSGRGEIAEPGYHQLFGWEPGDDFDAVLGYNDLLLDAGR